MNFRTNQDTGKSFSGKLSSLKDRLKTPWLKIAHKINFILSLYSMFKVEYSVPGIYFLCKCQGIVCFLQLET